MVAKINELGSGLNGLLPKAVFFNEFQKNKQAEFKKS
jgi:hypothetical protein